MTADKLQGRLGNGGHRSMEKMSENEMSLPQPFIDTRTLKADGGKGVLKECCKEQASAMLWGGKKPRERLQENCQVCYLLAGRLKSLISSNLCSFF